MKIITFIINILIANILIAQYDWSVPNCEAYKYYGDSIKYIACVKSEEINDHYQFSKEFHYILDKSLEIDPTYDYALRAKSVSYLKSGDFITWKKLIDKAVEINPVEHLGARAWCRFQFFHDYDGTIRDIEELDELVDYDLGYSTNGDYHLEIVRALAYKSLGQKEEAISILNNRLSSENYQDGLYDYLHLGVLYQEIGLYQKSLKALTKQSEKNLIAESEFYKAFSYKKLNNQKQYVLSLEKAKKLYIQGVSMNDGYNHYIDKIYLQQIDDELESGQ